MALLLFLASQVHCSVWNISRVFLFEKLQPWLLLQPQRFIFQTVWILLPSFAKSLQFRKVRFVWYTFVLRSFNSNKNKVSCNGNVYFSICYSYSDVRMRTMYDESGFLLLLRVLMAILMFSMEMEIGEEKKKAKMANIKNVW